MPLRQVRRTRRRTEKAEKAEKADKPGPGDEQRKIKLVTEQNVIDKPAMQEGFPMRKWSVEIYLLDPQGKQHKADCFQKVVYNLHPSFENPVQTFTDAPFKCENEGWGEFEMVIDLYYTDKSGKISVPHDLNFQKNHYEDVRDVTIKNPSQALQNLLRETGPLPSDDDRKRKADGVSKKAKKAFDVEKMADALVRLEEDDLLHVIQMIHDHKTDETYIQNNVDAGEFSVDLFTIPDNLGKMIWDYLVKQKVIEP
ncbi:transcription initiation factor TFIID subunit 14 [Diaporthe helianthi]|uniref:Transcription initiation factor TFIID subunit 14 n=1 Tax=Diaporthe helianthi TaxID=158607 RepID=A0A2P5HK02_DIAHE|nr:transcription initiation factor TFIID subunit 14 [Diaporthe helianthi]